MEYFLELKGDGIVPVKSQEIEEVHTINIKASYKSSYEVCVNEVLNNYNWEKM